MNPLALALWCLCLPAQPVFEPLGAPPGGIAIGLGISNDGSVVVGSTDIFNPHQAGGGWVWRRATGYRFLPARAGDPAAGAFAVSGDGRRVVGITDDPFLGTALGASWDSSTLALTVLGDLPGGEDLAVVNAVSRDGAWVVGTGSSDQAGSEAFRIGPGTGLRSLGFLPGDTWSEAYGVSADGTVAVGMAYPTFFESEPMMWIEEFGMFSLGRLPGSFGGYSYGVSDDGLVAVGVCHVDDPVRNNIFDHAFRWSQTQGLSELTPPPPFVGAAALCTNRDGSVIAGSLINDINHRFAMVWTPDLGCRRLSDILMEGGQGPRIEGWTLVEITGVSADGAWMVGNGYAPNAGYQPFRVHFPPPPACNPDYTADGNADQDDVACLIAAVAGNPSCTSLDSDFNHDGNVDQDDVRALIDVVAGGPCP